MVDHPQKRLGLAVSACLVLALAGILGSLVHAAGRQPFGGQRVVLHALALVSWTLLVWIALRSLRLAMLRYEIRDGCLLVDMGLRRWKAPLAEVRRIVQPGELAGGSQGWPGWNEAVIRGTSAPRYVASTLPDRRSLLIEAEGWSLLLSPRNPTAFAHALDEAAQKPSAYRGVTQEPASWAAWPVWHDWATIYPVAFSLLGALLLYVGAARVHPSLSRQITMIGSGAASRVLVPQDAARAIPLVAGLVAVTNGLASILLHRYNRILARLLIYGALVQQAILWVGLWRLVRG